MLFQYILNVFGRQLISTLIVHLSVCNFYKLLYTYSWVEQEKSFEI